MDYRIEDLLRAMVETGASDLHIKSGNTPGFRIDGAIVQQHRYGKLGPDETRQLSYQLLTKEQIDKYEAEGDLDCSFSLEGVARFRVNVLTQRGATGCVIRVIPGRIPTAEELGLPAVCLELARKPRGLVLVTGPTGSGKSTTLASMLDYINKNESGHILTMEDPLEFVHDDHKSFVTQRQIGTDCKDFAQALRRALRQDPDVILIGEMRDLETIELAITAAETGHLVLGTLHTTSAISTVDRMIDVFPTDAQQQVRVQLATTLQGVISQCLVPRNGGGRITAHEILVATDGVRSLIREGKTAQMLNFLQTGHKHGMTTLEQSLINLVNKGLVTLEDAVAKCNRPEEVRQNARPGKTRAAPSQDEMAGVYGNSVSSRKSIGTPDELASLYGTGSSNAAASARAASQEEMAGLYGGGRSAPAPTRPTETPASQTPVGGPAASQGSTRAAEETVPPASAAPATPPAPAAPAAPRTPSPRPPDVAGGGALRPGGEEPDLPRKPTRKPRFGR